MEDKYEKKVAERVEQKKLAVIGDLEQELQKVVHTKVYHDFLCAYTVSDADKLESKVAEARKKDEEQRMELIEEHLFMTAKEMGEAESDSEDECSDT